MADRQGVGIAYIVSLCGIMSGLAVAMMFCLGMIKPTGINIFFEFALV